MLLSILNGTKSNFLSLFFRQKLAVGYVKQVFKHSLNIKIGEQLIHIGSFKQPLSSYGIQINELDCHRIIEAVQPKDRVRLKQNQLMIYTEIGFIGLELQLFNEKNLKLDKNKQISVEELQHSRLTLNKFEARINEGSGLIQSNIDPFVLAGLTKYDHIEQLVLQVRYLLGRGIGLTPTGDDILYGYTLVRLLCHHAEDLLTVLQAELKQIRTTEVSYYYLITLIEGFVSEQAFYLEQILFTHDLIDLEHIIDKFVSYGHTSGFDLLIGFLCGLDYILTNEVKV
ncbi:oxamate carbamoyltransferase subunit AllH family protein [Amphibacillus sp. Q70]|uniref:oxamate carbamoyltransferase subunit AllH family protein n=1 Tax=Amphibacillus sp. Q70 TaxID=3453416 RepID=UPI003F83F566